MRTENVDNCGCKLVRVTTGLHMESCPLHEAAPELLEACRYAVENLKPKGTVTKDFSGHNAMATLSKAIAKAEGREP